MAKLKVGYARVSTTSQYLTAQRDGLAALGVTDDRVYVDHGLIGSTHARPGLREAPAACHTGDTRARRSWPSCSTSVAPRSTARSST